MKVIVKRPYEEPFEKEIENELKAIQNEVEGWIECLPVNNKVLMICNEEGKLKGLEPNFRFGDDVIVGNVIFCGEEGEDFADVPVTVEELTKMIGEVA